jgi:hypothetical protein
MNTMEKNANNNDFSRRTFLRTATLGTAGLAFATSAKSYGRIIGANDRVQVGVVGFSNRTRGSLIPAMLKNSERMNFEFIGVSDIWNKRRKTVQPTLKSSPGIPCGSTGTTRSSMVTRTLMP